MRIAVLACDDFSVLGGAERLVIDFSKALDADIVVPEYHDDIVQTYDQTVKRKFVSLQKKLPGEPMKQISGMRLFAKTILDYDFFISTDDMSMRYLVHDVPHFAFFHTPRRAMYDMYYPFLAAQHGIRRLGYWFSLNLFKYFDRRFVHRHVTNIACNSHNVRNRIYKVYQRDAHVLYPPVHVDNYSHRPPEGYWLSVGRVDKWKRIPLQIEAFRSMPEKTLLVAGKIYPAMEHWVENSPGNVKFLGPCDEQRLVDLYSRCEGFITTAVDEDFGITPLEAMASGKPVVATKEGGYLETVVDGKTGILVSPDTESVISAVRTISPDSEVYAGDCIRQAKKFDYPIFEENIRRFVTHCASGYQTK